MAVFRHSNLITRISAILCLVSILGLIPANLMPQGTGESIQTNYAVIEMLTEQAIGELIENMPALQRGKLVQLLKAKGAGGADFVFENVLVKKMRGAGIRVTIENPGEDQVQRFPADYRLSYQLIRMSLSYPKISRKYWLGAKQVERKAEVGVFAQLVELGSGDIIWIGDTEKKYEDVIGYSMLGYVEDDAIEFTKPERKEIRWSRFIEPVVVTGIVTGLIYLFFSNQSDEN